MSKKLIAVLAAATLALAVGACGGDDGDDSAAAQETDGAFIADMIPHHESAIEMAEIAQDRGEHPEIQRLADEIIDAQEAEISDLEAAHERIFGEPVSEADHGSMEMDEGMTEMDMAALENADPFDQAFIDMMVPHHQDAIEMARVELADGEDAELMDIAQQIIDSQSAEIEEMNMWREDWYGAPSPAGGVPPESEESSDEEMSMEH
jgi:uncharacterized protein (DUF305 family)